MPVDELGIYVVTDGFVFCLFSSAFCRCLVHGSGFCFSRTSMVYQLSQP